MAKVLLIKRFFIITVYVKAQGIDGFVNLKMPASNKQLLRQAELILSASKKIDYARLVSHDPDEVRKFKQLLAELALAKPQRDQSLSDFAEPAHAPRKPKVVDLETAEKRQKQQLQERRRDILAALEKDGFNERMGKVYDSSADSRSIAFKDVAHKRGLPPFDMVVAADYSPSAGLHGIFISAREIVSAL